MLTTLLLAGATVQSALQPVSPWMVRSEEGLCLLERHYQADGQPISLMFQPMLDLPSMELFVITPDKTDKQYVGAFTATLGAAEPMTGDYISVVSSKSKLRVTRLSITREVLDRMKHGDRLAIKADPVDRSFLIVQPDLPKLQLAGCIADLKKAWGIDPDIKDQIASQLEGNPAKWFSPNSYPREAWSNGIYGRVIALLNINDKGGVSACRILSSAGAALNAGTCKAAMNIRFTPARDVAGKPMPSTYILPVRWVLPGTEGQLKPGSKKGARQ